MQGKEGGGNLPWRMIMNTLLLSYLLPKTIKGYSTILFFSLIFYSRLSNQYRQFKGEGTNYILHQLKRKK